MCAIMCVVIVRVLFLSIWCVCVCVCSGIYPCALVTIDKETSFLNSAGNVKPKHIDKVQVILVFFHDALFPSRKSAVTHFCNTQAHGRTRTHTDLSPSGHTKCGQNRIALCFVFFFFWLWADHTSLSYIQYSTYINFLILKWTLKLSLRLEDLGHAPKICLTISNLCLSLTHTCALFGLRGKTTSANPSYTSLYNREIISGNRRSQSSINQKPVQFASLLWAELKSPSVTFY